MQGQDVKLRINGRIVYKKNYNGSHKTTKLIFVRNDFGRQEPGTVNTAYISVLIETRQESIQPTFASNHARTHSAMILRERRRSRGYTQKQVTGLLLVSRSR